MLNFLPLVGAGPTTTLARTSDPAVIRVAPPAPVFRDEERVAELAARRSRVAAQIGPKSILVMFSAEPRVYTNDVDYELRQENNLYYLTNLKQEGAILVLVPGNASAREILFLPRRNPAAETWTGHMYSPEEARRISGIGEIWEAKEFEPFMRAIRTRRAYRPESGALLMSSAQAPGVTNPVTPPVPKSDQTTEAATAATPARPVTGNAPANLVTQNASARTGNPSAASTPAASTTASTPAAASAGFEPLFAAMMQNDAALYLILPGGEESREYRQEQEFASKWAKSSTGLNVRSAWPIFVEMRMRKSPSELQLLQHAIDISIEGHQRAQAVASRVGWEYEVEAEIDYTYRRRNADNWGYPNIVGCGPNATTLHYEESQGKVNQGDLILIDSGAEYGHYTADVTRTFPSNGRFSPAQAEIYNIVLAAQEASFRAIRPGSSLGEVHNASVEVIKDSLLKLGLITDRNSDQFRIWFMHGTSHWLGMNVHDVGTRNQKLDTGMVFTVEPGVYIRLDALDYLPDTPENRKFIAAVRPAFEKYKGIGVRIEDDVVVTADGYKNLSAALPRTIADIEAFMARAQREVRVGEAPRDANRTAGRYVKRLDTDEHIASAHAHE
ncbi:MAG TPA: aminopeptidase P family protein [Pyrinomonadaceae bacterium]|nr:aminopeptidase P family protein [Pyrinomonadaceae bacterium]